MTGPQTQLLVADQFVDLQLPKVMGVLNVTPDSFSDGGQFFDFDRAVSHAEQMADEGAAFIDIGGESTRPGAAGVSVQEELDRVMPVIEAIAGRVDAIVSIDTSKPEVMREALGAGAKLINDVYALQKHGALEIVAESNCAVCLMHMSGEPRSMQARPAYADVVTEIQQFLKRRVAACTAAGIGLERIAVDPGFGFGKTDRHNLRVLADLRSLETLGRPLLVGLSRKRTLGNLTERDAGQRIASGLSAAVMAFERGASIVRTHDVAVTVDALKIAAAVRDCKNT